MGIMAAVRVAESEQRGYLLTGDPDYLGIYRTTVDAGAGAVADVEKRSPATRCSNARLPKSRR